MLIAAAILHAVLTLVVVLFQLALAAGAPWGHLAMGGRYPGRLPLPARIAAVVQAVLLVLFSFVVLGRAGLVSPPPPAGLVYVVLAAAALAAVLNLATPSIPERRLWGPVALVMLACVIRVAIG